MQSPKLEARPSRRGPGSIIAGVILTLIIALPVIMAVSAAIYYILGPAEGYLHADCSDSLYWANASYESGKVFDPTFRYAALLPFSAQLWMTPLVAVFGFTMKAQNIGMIIFVLVFCASLWYFCRRAEMSIGWCTLSVGITLMVLCSSDKLREIMLGHVIYYSLGLVLFFLMAGLCLSVTKLGGELLSLSDEKKPVSRRVMFGLTVLALLVVSAGSATDGTQMLVLATLPALGGVAAERFFSGKCRLFSRAYIPVGMALLSVLAGTLLGTVVLKLMTRGGISAEKYTGVYSAYQNSSKWHDSFHAFFKSYCDLLGITARDGDPLMDAASFGIIIRIAVAVTLLVLPAAMLLLYRKLCYRGTRVMLWGHIILSAGLMFGFVCGKLSNANWRLTPMIGSGVLLAVFAARELAHAGRARLLAAGEVEANENDDLTEEHCPAQPDDLALGRVELRSGLAFAVLLCLAALVSFGEIAKMPADYGRTNELHELTAFLEDNGLEYGYATFWRSNSITLLSDSRVKVREVLASSTSGIVTDYYQSSTRWYDETAHEKYDRYFVLLSGNELTTVSRSAMWNELTSDCLIEELEYDGYYVFVFSRDLDLNSTGIPF